MIKEVSVNTGSRIVAVENHPNYPHATELPMLITIIVTAEYEEFEEITAGISVEQATQLGQALLDFTGGTE